jgi:hypothetical protein
LHDEKEWNASKWVGQMVYLNSIKLYIVKISMFLDGDSKINNTFMLNVANIDKGPYRRGWKWSYCLDGGIIKGINVFD